MPDTLDVSGGASTVSTDDIDAAAGQLERLSAQAGAVAAELAALPSIASPWSSDDEQARLNIEVAITRLRDIASGSTSLVILLRTAARAYEEVELFAGALIRDTTTAFAQWLGSRVPAWLLQSGVLLSFAGGAWLGIRAAGGLAGVADRPFQDGGIPKASPAVREHNELWTNTVTVGAVRTVAQALGPVLLGAVGAPPLAGLVAGTGASEFGARGLVGLGRSQGLLVETGVRLVESKEQPVGAPPVDYVDRLARIPYEEDGSGPQVMIERYSVAGGPDRFAVYVTGTATFSPVATDQPWDMTSNLSNAAGIESGSVAAVKAAMEAAGVTPDSPVQLTGYSQGGGTVACIAASGEYSVQGLVSFGGPTGQIPLQRDLPAVLVEHSDDIVPALGGEQSNAGALLVRRDVYDDGAVSKEWGVPAHHIENYIKTAHLMDTSGSPQLVEAMQRLDSFTAGATLESSTVYRFERTEG